MAHAGKHIQTEEIIHLFRPAHGIKHCFVVVDGSQGGDAGITESVIHDHLSPATLEDTQVSLYRIYQISRRLQFCHVIRVVWVEAMDVVIRIIEKEILEVVRREGILDVRVSL